MSGRDPVITSSAAAHFWDEVANHRYVLQKCDECGTFRYPPGPICPSCMSDNVSWQESQGQGEIFTFTTVYRAPSAEFDSAVPYTVALVDLDEGPRVMGNVIECPPEDITVTARVSVTFEDVGGRVLPQFRLDGSTHPAQT
jgi:uncharacterized OB-fold protein